jgi:hypothetical protein
MPRRYVRNDAFELDGQVRQPSAAVLAGPRLPVSHFDPLDLDAVEAITGRPVLTFPYGFYTEELATGYGSSIGFEEEGIRRPVHPAERRSRPAT